MSRYVCIARPRARYSYELDCEVSDQTTITVHEADELEPTGLLDMHGNELYRARDTVQMGFVNK